MNEYKLSSPSHRLEMAIAGVNVNGAVAEDKHAADAFRKFGQQLVSRYNAICGQPFRLELWETKCDGDEPHAHVIITSIDEAGDEAVTVGEPQLTHLDYIQYYHAANRDDPEQNYAGKVRIDVYMHGSEATDGDSLAVENPAVYALADMAYCRYVAMIAEEYPEWITAYMDAPFEHVVY